MIDSLEREIKDLRADLDRLKSSLGEVQDKNLVLETELEEHRKYSLIRDEKNNLIINQVIDILQKLREKL
mgnify:CR=1 FL=1